MKRNKKSEDTPPPRVKKSPRANTVENIQNALIRTYQEAELCEELAVRFARQSTSAGDFATVRMRYTEIIKEIRCLRHTPASQPLPAAEKRKLKNAIRNALNPANRDRALETYLVALRRGTVEHPSLQQQLAEDLRNDHALKKFLGALDKTVQLYVSARLQEEPGATQIGKVELGSSLMSSLGIEWVRDRKMLSNLLSAVFKKWREIDQPRSRFRFRAVVADIAPRLMGDRSKIQTYCESIGVLSTPPTGKLSLATRLRIGKCVSRQFGDAMNARSPETRKRRKRARKTQTAQCG